MDKDAPKPEDAYESYDIQYMEVEMKVWLDDQVSDPDTPQRHPPPGWVGVATAISACRLLARGGVTHVSLDHDLGAGQMTGYTVARFIEKRAHEGRLGPLQWTVHSANPVGAAKMRQALLSAERAWILFRERNGC